MLLAQIKQDQRKSETVFQHSTELVKNIRPASANLLTVQNIEKKRHNTDVEYSLTQRHLMDSNNHQSTIVIQRRCSQGSARIVTVPKRGTFSFHPDTEPQKELVEGPVNNKNSKPDEIKPKTKLLHAWIPQPVAYIS